MPRFIPTIPFDDCYGSVGDLTFFHRDGKCFYKARSQSSFAGTMLQMDHQSVHLRAIAAWQDLTQEVQEEWNANAVGVVSHRPPFDGKSGISGYNLFVSAYHGFATLGDEHVPSPAPWTNFPVFAVPGVDSVSAFGDDLLINFKVMMEETVEAGRYWLLTKLHLTKPGGGKDDGKLRNFLASSACHPGESIVQVEVLDYLNIWDTELSAYTVHCRYLLIDGNTGYRGQYRQMSFDFSI